MGRLILIVTSTLPSISAASMSQAVPVPSVPTKHGGCSSCSEFYYQNSSESDCCYEYDYGHRCCSCAKRFEYYKHSSCGEQYSSDSDHESKYDRNCIPAAETSGSLTRMPYLLP
ncbi:hypothetical protein B0H17DRAFT_1334516 [Mycena rosella]|uniref:Uncharacterized protein n=1 Tax=Mycena rosella TaxID=1033263 RepID=A0AAD7G7Y3_MYCRO|nr:hypothetical protein B0H17DRAFT_1334516 [Mycena rosella]